MNVVRMAQRAPSQLHASAGGERLRRQSRLLAGLLLIIVIALATLTLFRAILMLQRYDNFMLGHDLTGVVVVWCRSGLADVTPPFGVSGSQSFSTLASWQAAFMAFDATLRAAPALFILWTLHKMFQLFSEPKVFSPRLTHRIRAIAWSLFCYAALPIVIHVGCYLVRLTPYALHWEVREIDALLLGLVLLPIAHVMSFGNDIERERDGFI